MRLSGLISAAVLATTALAAPATYAPHENISLAVSVPTSSSSGSRPMYMQFSFPTKYTWAAFGIGSAMAGSTIFVLYADGNGNVTLSPREGLGTFMPQFSSSLNSETQLLAGSGISNGVMVANIRFTASSSILDVAGTSTSWIAAWYEGSALNTASQSAPISRHDSHSTFSLDLSAATQAEDVNPFVAAATTPAADISGSPGATSTSGNGVSMPVATGAGGSSGVSTGTSESSLVKFRRAHGLLMAIAMLVVLPLGAMFMRRFGGVWIHAAIQILGLCMIIAGFGTGFKLADDEGYLYENSGKTHTAFGTAVFALFLVQPLGGFLHHMIYRRTHKRGVTGLAHIWYGRGILILGTINGGLGLKLSEAEKSLKIVYTIGAVIPFVIYVVMVAVPALRKKGANNATAYEDKATVRHKEEVRSEDSMTEAISSEVVAK